LAANAEKVLAEAPKAPDYENNPPDGYWEAL